MYERKQNIKSRNDDLESKVQAKDKIWNQGEERNKMRGN